MRICVLFFCFLMPLTAWSHQTRPMIADIEIINQKQLRVSLTLNLESFLAGISQQHRDTDDAPQAEYYNTLRRTLPKELEALFLQQKTAMLSQLKLSDNQGRRFPLEYLGILIPDVEDVRLARYSTLQLQSIIPDGVSRLNWQADTRFGDNIVRFYHEDSKNKQAYLLKGGELSPVYPLQGRSTTLAWQDIVKRYIVLGYEHILPKGIDHILFVLGLLLFSLKLAPLLWQVTAFTLAHSVTLGLSIYQVVSLPAYVVEPLIAASILYIGIENLMHQNLHKQRLFLVFAFGLLHGLGFASVLTDLGMPEAHFLTALLSFNVGVELGQLSVIAMAWLLIYHFRSQPQLFRKILVIPASIAISLIAFYWMIERIPWGMIVQFNG